MNTVVIILSLIFLFGITLFFLKKEKPGLRMILLWTLLVRFAGGLALGCVYFFHYGYGDTISYFSDARLISDSIIHNPTIFLKFLFAEDGSFMVGSIENTMPRAFFMVKLTSVMSFISGGNYWVASLYFSFMAGLTAWYFYKTIRENFSGAAPAATIAILFFPSVVFWGSGITKENVALGSVFVLASCFTKVMISARVRVMEWAMAVIAFFLAWSLKYYWMAVFTAVAVSSIFTVRIFLPLVKPKRQFALWIAWVGCLLLVAAGVSTLKINFNFDYILQVVVENHQAFVERSQPENVIHFWQLNPTWGGMLLNAPLALMSVLFRPVFFEANTPLQVLASLENLIIAGLVIASLLKFRRMFLSEHRILLFSILIYTVVLGIFLALSTPNFGTLVRYRVGFLPFFVLLLLLGFPFPDFIRKRLSHLAP